MKVLVTGSSGLIGSEMVAFFAGEGHQVVGIDNNMRADFFGEDGDTTWNRDRLLARYDKYQHITLDIRDRQQIVAIVKTIRPELIVHAAAQPSHDLAARRPFDDFDVNAVGTLNVLEATRLHSPDAVFVHMSTNKVYGDAPNEIPLRELPTRWDFADPFFHGFDETCRLDQSKHSVFGASKVAADVMVQEYGRYFGIRTCCLRGGCLTGPNHSGVQLHGFLSYIVKVNVQGGLYTLFGYKGKQVRDNIHALDVARFVSEFYRAPRCGEVYNIGGGRRNSCSLLEAIDAVEQMTGRKMNTKYEDQNREGDHICYISNVDKAKSHYPNWSVGTSLDTILEEIVAGWGKRVKRV